MRELLEMVWCCKNERINTSMRINKLIQVEGTKKKKKKEGSERPKVTLSRQRF